LKGIDDKSGKSSIVAKVVKNAGNQTGKGVQEDEITTVVES